MVAREDPEPQSRARRPPSVIRLIAAGQQEQHRRALGHAAWARAALDQQPGADGDAAGAAERHGRAERQLAQRHARPEPDRRALEHLQEGDHVADARQHLEPDREDHPADRHVHHRPTSCSPGTASSSPTTIATSIASEIRPCRRLRVALASSSSSSVLARRGCFVSAPPRSPSCHPARHEPARAPRPRRRRASAPTTRARSRCPAPTPGSTAATRPG